jgi:hypothetical protein
MGGFAVLRYVSRALTGEDQPTIGVYLTLLNTAVVALMVLMCFTLF